MVPWYVKFVAKLGLSALPVPYNFWKGIGLLEHGRMEEPKYACDVLLRRLSTTGLDSLEDLTVLELGPGDSLATALIASALGARRVLLVDEGRFATSEMAIYHRIDDYLSEELGARVGIRSEDTVATMLDRCGAEYLTDGLVDIRGLPENSVDVIISQAVLEHVPREDFAPLMSELARIMRPGGVSSHEIDYRDHLGGGLNHLRFSDRIWESAPVHRSGFYTNRLRFQEMHRVWEDVGYQVEIVATDEWSEMPIDPENLDPRFQNFSVGSLLIRTAEVVLWNTEPEDIGQLDAGYEM